MVGIGLRRGTLYFCSFFCGRHFHNKGTFIVMEYFSLSLKMETRNKGLKEQQQHHKKLLAAMLSQDSFDSVNSPALSIAEEEMEDEDDAMELLGKFLQMFD